MEMNSDFYYEGYRYYYYPAYLYVAASGRSLKRRAKWHPSDPREL